MENNSTGSESATSAPIGTVPASGSTSSQISQPAEPSVLDLDDNALIRVKGSDKPVKFSDHVRGFQAQATKANQMRAALEKRLQEREQQLARYEQERQAAASRQSQGGSQNPSDDVYAALSQLPYLTGKDAVEVVQSIGNQIKERDQVLLGTLRHMKHLESIVNELHQTHTSSSFDSRIDRWLTEGGYPMELRELAKEVYLAYEGDNLNDEFPQIFAARVDQVRKAFEAERVGKLNAARRVPFVPGRGGQAGPSKPLEIKQNASSRQTADDLWELLQKSET